MRYTKENLSNGLTPEYISACKSLDMWLRRRYGNRDSWNASYNRGEMSDCRGAYWFAPPIIEGYQRGWCCARMERGGESFGILASSKNTTYSIRAKIPCDKLRWEIVELY